MSMHVHKLEGCAPTPLAHYLKALAVLRLVAEQRDPGARGFWKDEAFWLATALTREELVRFFLEEYRPTPILSPWNGGSGFYYDDDPALSALEKSRAARFAEFRHGIAAARGMAERLSAAIRALKIAEVEAKAAGKSRVIEAAELALKIAKAEREEAKTALLPACRQSWGGGQLQWFDAALALGTDADPSWPALLGSGGNDGRLDFTNNSMQHLAVLFDCDDPQGRPRPLATGLLSASLFAEAAPGLLKKAMGQFFPGSAGGDNMGTGFSGEALVNPWDFVLMLEGTIVLASSIVRSGDGADLPQAAAPFAVRSSGVGYGSSASADEGPRGEQWMPLWSRPARHAEVRALFSEGRVRVGRATAGQAAEAARGVARLGVARGVTRFERYGYIERNGQANLAVPLGSWIVSPQPHNELLGDVDGWVGRLHGLARDKRAPRAVASAARVLDEAILAVCKAGGEPRRWQALLIALGGAEAALVGSPAAAANLSPLPPLDPAWLDAAQDGSPELRLAAALAAQDVVLRRRDGEIHLGIRAHWMPLDRAQGSRHAHADRAPARFAVQGRGLASDPDVVCTTNDLERDCLALVRRRVQLAPALGARGLGLLGAPRIAPTLADVGAFLAREVDDARIMALARPLMAIRWSAARVGDAPRDGQPEAAYAVARLAHLAGPLRRAGGNVDIRLDPEPIARLSAGDLAAAMAVCLRRLRASGLVPKVRVFAGDQRYALRLAGSLAFPLRDTDVSRCADLVTKPNETEDCVHVD